jgi:hypothetical protein
MNINHPWRREKRDSPDPTQGFFQALPEPEVHPKGYLNKNTRTRRDCTGEKRVIQASPGAQEAQIRNPPRRKILILSKIGGKKRFFPKFVYQ